MLEVSFKPNSIPQICYL